MKKINFKEFQIQENLFSDTKTLVDLREGFSNVVYKNSQGIKGLDLALKIYKSDGETEFNDDELQIIRSVCDSFFVAILDGKLEVTVNDVNPYQKY